MPKTEVRQAVYNYLKPENSNIPYLSTVYTALPKISNEQDLFSLSPPGTGVGAIIFMFFESQSETRIALGGQHSGWKMRPYGLSLLCIMKSDLTTSYEGQDAFDKFIDGLVSWVEADRNAGTEAVSLGGFGPYAGTGVVWSWGEGSGVNGGADIRIDYPVPKTVDGQVMLFQAVVRVSVVEMLMV